jgi:hypothetical protein
VHRELRARLGQANIERGTAILFNSKQLHRQLAVTRDSKFCNLMLQLGSTNNLALETAAGAKEEITTAAEGGDDIFVDPNNNIDENLDEFIHVDVSGRVATIADSELFPNDKSGLESFELTPI